jgi:hypothetical protein
MSDAAVVVASIPTGPLTAFAALRLTAIVHQSHCLVGRPFGGEAVVERLIAASDDEEPA